MACEVSSFTGFSEILKQVRFADKIGLFGTLLRLLKIQNIFFHRKVCSSWIGCGISRDINDVKRIQQLLVHSLEKIGTSQEDEQHAVKREYSESSYTLETLAVLKAWAQV